MSLATRCPACGTTFRIEPEQLALADGWARCGRCSTVFDAAAERRDDVDVATVAATATRAPATPAVAAPNDADAFAAALQSFRADGLPSLSPSMPRPAIDDESDDVAPTAHDASPASLDAMEPLSPAAPPAPTDFDPWRELPSLSLGPDAAVPPADQPVPPPPVPSGPGEPSSGSSGVRPAVRGESVAPTGVIHAASEPVDDGGAGPGTPRGAGRRRSWRWAILVVAIVLLLVLLAQVMYRQRDAVAARHPALRPALAGLCNIAGCTIGPLRRPGDITIEGATFTHAQDDDRYRLAFALRNQADVPLAMPAIELSLLDAQERAVVRRVLMPADLGVAQTTLPALAEQAVAVSFALDDRDRAGAEAAAGDDPLPRVAGYAMVAFYP